VGEDADAHRLPADGVSEADDVRAGAAELVEARADAAAELLMPLARPRVVLRGVLEMYKTVSPSEGCRDVGRLLLPSNPILTNATGGAARRSLRDLGPYLALILVLRGADLLRSDRRARLEAGRGPGPCST
jgi:hypothetical protein